MVTSNIAEVVASVPERDVNGKTLFDDSGKLNTHMAPVTAAGPTIKETLVQAFFKQKGITDPTKQAQHTFRFPVTYGTISDLFSRGMVAKLELQWTDDAVVDDKTVWKQESLLTGEVCTNQLQNDTTSIYTLFPTGENSQSSTGWGPCKLSAENLACRNLEYRDVSAMPNINFPNTTFCCRTGATMAEFTGAYNGETMVTVCCANAATKNSTTCSHDFILPRGWGETTRTFPENLKPSASWPISIIKVNNFTQVPAFTSDASCRNALISLLAPVGTVASSAGGPLLIDVAFTCNPYQNNDKTQTYYVMEKADDTKLTWMAWKRAIDAIRTLTVSKMVDVVAPPVNTPKPADSTPPPSTTTTTTGSGSGSSANGISSYDQVREKLGGYDPVAVGVGATIGLLLFVLIVVCAVGGGG